jgi:membrane protease YdiL (CAAX protease family)
MGRVVEKGGFWILFVLGFRILVVPLLSFTVSPIPPWLEFTVYMLGYLGALFLLFFTANHLQKFNIDKGAFFLILFGAAINVIMSRNMMKFLIFIPCIFLSLYIFYQYIKNRKGFNFSPVKGMMDLWVGALAGFVFVVFMIIVGLYLFQNPLTISWATLAKLNLDWGAFFFRFTYELESNSAIEELLFRGFVIGYLCQRGIRKSYVILIQGFLFWIAHINSFTNWYFVLIYLPISSLLYGWLTIRSKSILPSMISHAIINSWLDLF